MTLTVHGRDQLYGWGGTIMLHLVAAIILLFWQIETPPAIPETVEIEFVALTPPKPAVTIPARAKPAPTAKARTGKAQPSTRTRRVKLPERSSVSRDDVLALPSAKKLDAPEGAGGSRRTSTAGSATKNRRAGSTAGTRTGQAGPGSATGKGLASGRNLPGIADRDAGSSALGSVQWIGGGKRRKISGNLPRYPAGTNVEAQIRVEAVVTPNGSVKSVRPAQKANARLEEAAMKELRKWRFEPLARKLPQKDQRCIVTFNFKLQ